MCTRFLPGDLVKSNGLMRIVPGYSYAGYDGHVDAGAPTIEPAMYVHSDRLGLVLACHESRGLMDGSPDLVEALILCPDVGYAWFDVDNFEKIE